MRIPKHQSVRLLNLTDEEARKRTSESPDNGGYATLICCACGNFTTHPEGDAEKAELVDVCRNCWETQIAANNIQHCG